MKAAIFGSSGLLGSNLKRSDPNSYLGVSRRESSTTDIVVDSYQADDATDALRSMDISSIIFAAGLANPKINQSNPTLSFHENLEILARVIETALALQVSLIFLSTDKVFDGCEDGIFDISSGRSSCSVYGQNKIRAENLLFDSGLSGAIIRLPIIYGVETRNQRENMSAIDSALKSAAAGQPSTLYSNWKRSFVSFHQLAVVINQYVSQPLTEMKVHHCVENYGSYFKVGRDLAKQYGLNPEHIKPSVATTESTLVLA